MGWDWPFSPIWFVLITVLLLLFLLIHSRSLLSSTLPALAWKLISLRLLGTIFLLLLLARPFIISDEPNPKEFQLLTFTDLSGSMNTLDGDDEPRRIEKVRPFFDSSNPNSWISQMKDDFGKVDSFGFSNQVQRLDRNSWGITELGKKTALGDALLMSLKNKKDGDSVGSVVVFSDGRNNSGVSILEVAKKYRAQAIPINVVGVGKDQKRGDLSVNFSDRKPKAIAKEELFLSAELVNKFEDFTNAKVRLMLGENTLEEIKVSLSAGEKREINFSPIVPKQAGPRRYRILINPPRGDADPSNDSDSLLVVVKAPDQFSTLYISNQIRPLFPFVKRVLVDEERFKFCALVQLSEKAFHVFGEEIKPEYPKNPSFWMNYDAILLDTGVLDDLNKSLVSSLKDFVQKKGGGLLLFGEIEEARSKLGGVIPVKKVERVLAKENLSLITMEEPLFGPIDEVSKMKPFLPRKLPGFFVKEQNQAARGVVLSRANGKPVLSVQAYGAGKVGYWGSPNDWRRSLNDEDGSKEFRHFWQALVQWLGTGGEDRLKTEDSSVPFLKGLDTPLRVDALGADFEPSMDAMVEARISGPDNFKQIIQLYPEGSLAGRYAGSFRPSLAGAYEVNYSLKFPDGETLKRNDFLRVSEAGEETVDVSFARLDLQMLAKLTGGQYLSINEMKTNWQPTFALDLPSVKKQHSLANVWILFIALFAVVGIEWIMRRQAGLR